MHIFEAKFSGFALGNVTMCVCVVHLSLLHKTHSMVNQTVK